MQVQLDLHRAEVVPGEVADAPQAITQGAAVDRERAGGGVVVPAAFVVLPEGGDQVGSVGGVVVDQRAESFPDEGLHFAVGRTRREEAVDPELVEPGDPAG